MAIADRSNALVNISDASRNFLNLVKPQTTTSRADAGDNANTQALIQQLLASGQDDHQALIDSILQRSAIDFGPVRAAEIGSGGYNSTVLKQLQDEARARATGEATGAVLQAKTEAERTAANLEAAKLNANRTQVVQPPTSLSTLLKSVGVSLAANKLFKVAAQKTAGIDFGFPHTGGPKSSLAGSPENSDIFGYDQGFGGGSTVNAGGSEIAASGGLELGGGGESLVSGTSGGLTADEISSILGTASDAALGNSATLASFTDSTVSNSAVDAIPDAFGDYSVPLSSYSGEGIGVQAAGGVQAGDVIGTSLAAEEAGSEVLSASSSASALGGGAAAAETGATATASAEGSGLLAGVGAGAEGLLATFGETVFPAVVGGVVVGEVGSDILSSAFGGQHAGLIGDIGDYAGDLGRGLGDIFDFGF